MRIVSLIVLYLLALSCVHAQSVAGPPKPAVALSWGEVENGKFSSPRLGLTLSIPAEYTLISSAEAEILEAAGADVLKKGGTNRSIDEALNRTIQLLAIAEQPLGTPKNAALEIVAIKQQSGATAKMSLAANVMVLKGTPYVLKESLGSVKIGTIRYEAAELEGNFSGIILKQRMYVVMQKGYSVVVAITYSTDQQISDMLLVLSTLSLSK